MALLGQFREGEVLSIIRGVELYYFNSKNLMIYFIIQEP